MTASVAQQREPSATGGPDQHEEPLEARDRLPSPAEWQVLRVLWASPDYLVRGEIHRRIPRTERPTAGRIGQILPALHADDLLLRELKRSRGSQQAGFYTLSEKGVALCRRLGFDREDEALFSTTDEMLSRFLTRDCLARRPETTGRVVAVCGYQGGLGRTTMVAHLARGLALRHSDQKHLAIDLALDAPGLDGFFAPEGLGGCRGLGGLVVDFHQQQEWKRTAWLRDALAGTEYLLRPLEDVPNLFYLPSGLTPGHHSLSTSERAEALSCLREEVGLSRLTSGSEPSAEQRGFLNEFRSALLEEFDKILVDPQVGRSMGAWIANQILADEMVLCARLADTSTATLEGLRAILANFIKRRDEEGQSYSSLFVFPLSEPGAKVDPEDWVDQNIATIPAGAERPPSLFYRTERVVYNLRLQREPNNWNNTELYRSLIEHLEKPDADEATVASPELQALLDVLNPDTSPDRRSLAAGFLENSPTQDLARWVSWYAEEKSLHVRTDAEGRSLMEGVARAQARRLVSTLIPETVATPSYDKEELFARFIFGLSKKMVQDNSLQHRLNSFAQDAAELPGLNGIMTAIFDRKIPFAFSARGLSLPRRIATIKLLLKMREEFQEERWTPLPSERAGNFGSGSLVAKSFRVNEEIFFVILASGRRLCDENHPGLDILDKSKNHFTSTIQDALLFESANCMTSLQMLLRKISKGVLEGSNSGGDSLEPVAYRLSKIFKAEAVTILIQEQGNLYLSASTDEDLSRGMSDKIVYRPGEGLTGYILEKKESLRLIDGLDPDERMQTGLSGEPVHPEAFTVEKAVANEAVQFLGTPMRIVGRQFLGVSMPSGHSAGVIRVLRGETAPQFTYYEEEALQYFADHFCSFINSSWQIFVSQSVIEAKAEAICITRNEPGESPGDPGIPKIVYADPGAENFFGLTRKDLIGLDVQELYSRGEYEEVRRCLAQAIKDNQKECGPFKFKMKGPKKEDRYGNISYRIVTSPFVQPATQYTVSVIRDVTENERILEILNKRGLAYFRVDKNGYTIRSTPAEYRITGHTQKDLVTMRRHELYLNPQDRPALLKKVDKYDGRLFHATMRLKRQKGEPFIAQGGIRLLKDKSGQKIGYEGLYEDVTNRIRLQAFIDADTDKILTENQLYKELERNAAFHLDFMTSLGHQLRTPLAALIENLLNLSEGVISPEKSVDRVEYIIAQAKTCALLVANLTYMDKILRDEPFDFDAVDLGQLALETERGFAHLLREKDLTLAVDCSDLDSSRTIYGHRELLRQVFVNLVDNAIKYSQPGTRMDICGYSRPKGAIFEIANYGLPIPNKYRGAIFSRGFRLPKAVLAVPHGTGLGLWLVRKVVEAHGASIQCPGSDDKGNHKTIFLLYFPYKKRAHSVTRSTTLDFG